MVFTHGVNTIIIGFYFWIIIGFQFTYGDKLISAKSNFEMALLSVIVK